MIKIKKATLIDFEQYKKIKILSLQEAPTAFDTSYEEVLKWSLDKWEKKFADMIKEFENLFLLVFDSKKLVAFAHIEFQQKNKKKHIAEFPTLYVRPEYRNKGIAENLISHLLMEIKDNFQHILKIQVSVYEKQKTAISLYRKMGFKIYGEFYKELFLDGEFITQYAMELFLQK